MTTNRRALLLAQAETNSPKGKTRDLAMANAAHRMIQENLSLRQDLQDLDRARTGMYREFAISERDSAS